MRPENRRQVAERIRHAGCGDRARRCHRRQGRRKSACGAAAAAVEPAVDYHQDRCRAGAGANRSRSEEHTSELQSLMRISYAVFCLKKKRKPTPDTSTNNRVYNATDNT